MKTFVVVVLFLLFSFLVADESTKMEPKIVNGQETTMEKWNESFSGVVALITEKGDGYYSTCTATLIDPQVLLTAGHCVFNRDADGNITKDAISNPSIITVKSGLHASPSTTTIAVGKTIIAHEDWDGNIENGLFEGHNDDIALILLDKKISDLRIYPLRDDPMEEKGDKGLVVGYGITNSGEHDSGTQRWGEATILDIWTLTDQQLEIGDPSNTCSGDSGGPFFTEQSGGLAVSGVTSYHDGGDCSSTANGFKVHVIQYRDWVEEKMEILTGHDLATICGDGDIDEGETCERGSTKECSSLGNYVPGASASCNVDCSGYNVSDCTVIVCGDGIVHSPEVCDDGNADNGDYCSSDCSNVTGRCGDGTQQSNEECDDGNTNSGDGCDRNCYKESAGGTGYCGNGIKEVGEECDDGNTTPYDGCDSNCRLESTGGSGTCGNGIKEVGEECDDGNTTPFDGCNQFCRVESNNDSSGGCSSLYVFQVDY